jgi:hypothetical protein
MPQLGLRVRGVFHCVVQNRRTEHLVVRDTQAGENRRDCGRMGDVRVTATAFLALVTLGCDIVRAVEQLDVSVWPDGQDNLAEFHIQF